MTTTVVVTVPKDATYKAVVTTSENGVDSTRSIFGGGQESFYLFQGRKISIEEVSLTDGGTNGTSPSPA